MKTSFIFARLIFLLLLIFQVSQTKAIGPDNSDCPDDVAKYPIDIPLKKSTENYLYQAIEHLTKPQLLSLIDSLLDAPSIDKFLIEEINQYIKINFEEIASKTPPPDSFSKYPSNQFYYNWDTDKIHAYSKNLSKGDTSLLIVLNSFHPPVVGKITSDFGHRKRNYHNGIDIDLNTGAPVKAAFEGMVRIAKRHGCYGKIIIIRHYNGLETFYAHLSKIKVKTGQLVKAGDIIGTGGSTGRSTGSHLHFETRFKGIPLNPRNFISFSDQKLQADTLILKKNKASYFVYVKGSGYHTVKRGESVYAITQKYGMPAKKFCAMNGITVRTMLRVGQKLRIS